jgi:uncharacterized protein YprB with RNaseH-like and TPR domain
MSSEPKVLLWDIETDGINADRILCVGYKWYGQKRVHLLRAEDYPRVGLWDDKGLTAAFAKVFSSADYHVTWYGARFDLPVVNARCIANRIKPLPPIAHVDLWKTARYCFKTGGGNRLAKWQDFLGLPDEKTPVRPSVWIKARYGHGPSLQYIYDHCRADVLVLEGVFEQLKPWVKDVPNMGLFTEDRVGCINCGSFNLHKRGWHVSITRKYQRLQCQDCGKWQRSSHCFQVNKR